MADSVYEGLFIFDANKFARDQTAASSSVEAAIAELGGEVLVSRLWEERRLAYPINGHRKGAYWLMYFKLPGTEISALNRRCDLNELVLRQLVLKIHPRLVEPILAHATVVHEDEEEAPSDEVAEPVTTGA